ncbi:MAG: hypothetical protein AVDCRST_MAG17-647 [uncultured Solirubrobacterales bacterium]|uniref:Uncharacterized protein n=1 Tax=uncultured Solirubrobacterales bacterium TaxID=768556 RepID=A0A6J4SC75_9ACTN|nr:MAG: hypothetical protein AVDCRST_MAG17-647 [uncultured Solirubrobacterales bacterium]
MADEERAKRVDVGFSGGQVLSLRMPDAAYRSLSDEVRSGSQGWHQVEAEDSDVSVNLGQVVYVRLDTEQQRVGF